MTTTVAKKATKKQLRFLLAEQGVSEVSINTKGELVDKVQEQSERIAKEKEGIEKRNFGGEY